MWACYSRHLLQWPLSDWRRSPQGWPTARRRLCSDTGDAGAALASRALELEAELAALDRNMMQVTVAP